MKKHIHFVLHVVAATSIVACAILGTAATRPFASMVTDQVVRVFGEESSSEHVSSAARQYCSQSKAEVTVTASQSSDGISKLFAGQADIALISRQVSSTEAERAVELNKTLRMLAIGLDGITVVVHPAIGRDLKGLDLVTLERIFIDGSVTNWSQILPGHASSPINAFVPSLESGTTTCFLESYSADTTQLSSTVEVVDRMSEIAHRVANDRLAIGLLASGTSADGLTTVPLRRQDGELVRCNETTLRNGTYPLSRRLSAVTTLESGASAQQFLSYLASVDGQEVLYGAGMVTSMIVNMPTHANATIDAPGAGHGKKSSGH